LAVILSLSPRFSFAAMSRPMLSPMGRLNPIGESI
jgi:hypothetical protein